jgi:hypothetical protein
VNAPQRPFRPDSPREDVEAIADRVSIVADRVLLLREIPVQSPFSIDVMFDRLEALCERWPRFVYVVDLSEATRPGPETRAALKARVLRISARVEHVAFVVGGNVLMRAMARLVAYGMGLRSVSIHVTRAEALEEAARAVER